ncbi:MAG: gliding motility-associated protein GldE [Bacteroidetes bacterium]|uniref:Gliding motility-associated protein GldE n=1 Tax=Phaeocystidibacter marisrubri TaxID=1577780 RepID=A0A6L3ZG16_9FLAO|nr:gliding motility-associated protein GldE [Phaeocystidibacter marisrubri]KAB2815889.1 gliding motility-associated protein GldE [Phaeocystidibacter marisrubri]TNE30733.1 MAG: gliding motility-associated protein GldE [Bacteroidota bacterium]
MDPDPSSLLASSIVSFDPTLIIPLIILGLLLLASAMVSGSEVAFFSLTPTDKQNLEQSEDSRDRVILQLLDDPESLLATILVNNNFINIGIVLLSSFIVDKVFDFTGFESIGLMIELVVITFLILLFGEILPKVYANTNNLGFARWMARPMLTTRKGLKPLIAVLKATGHLLSKPKKSSGISMDELEQALDLTDGESTTADEQKILRGIVRFGSTTVKQIMKPRMDIVAFDVNESFPSVMKQLLECGYSRIPVYRDNSDVIVGVLYIKDLLPHIDAPENFAWQDLLRDPFFVPGSKKIDDLLKEFQEKKIHLAVVVDEFGGTDGIVTLEDVIEEIVGDISDEFDVEQLVYSKLDEKNYVFEGKTQITDFYKVLEISNDPFDKVKGEADTLAGLLLELSGQFPTKGHVEQYDRYTFVVEAVDQRRIKRIKVTIEDIEENDEDA